MSPTDWIAAVNGAMLAVLTVKTFWGWVFGREHSEQNLGERLRRVETEVAVIRDRAIENDKDIAVLQTRVNNRNNR